MLRGLLSVPRARHKGFQSPTGNFLWPQAALPHFVLGSQIFRSPSIPASGPLRPRASRAVLHGGAKPGCVISSVSSLLPSVHPGSTVAGVGQGVKEGGEDLSICLETDQQPLFNTPLAAGCQTGHTLAVPCGRV